MKETIKDIILEYQPVGSAIVREQISIPLDSGLIVSIIGSRRSGKTYVLHSIIQDILQKGVEKRQIVFINFEDERLQLDQSNLDVILQAYQELYPSVNLQDVYFFFDEIQNVSGWEKFIRRLYDTRSKRIFVTGSNSKLLSTEIATELRGRTLTFTVYPFCFSEYLRSHDVIADTTTQAGRSMVNHYAARFMSEGGFPELSRLDTALKNKLLQEYFNVMIYRDIVERYAVSNPLVLKFFIKKIFSSVTVPLSVNKIFNDLKSMGYKVSNTYLYDYMDYCNAVFLTQSICKFDFSEIKRAKSDKKVYVIDTGLLAAIDFKATQNRGTLLENQVALEFLKRGKELAYYKDSYECDFVVTEPGECYTPVQVSWSIADPATRDRELRGLVQACKLMGAKEGTVITFDEQDRFNQNGVEINVISFGVYFTTYNKIS